MSKCTTNTIVDIEQNSLADTAGIKKGDKVLSINGHKIHDELDLTFYSHDPSLRIKIKRGRRTITIRIVKVEYESIGIRLNPLKVRTCNNNCIFCFVHQLPRGLRRTLYVKDEDYRFSFLFGNYPPSTG